MPRLTLKKTTARTGASEGDKLVQAAEAAKLPTLDELRKKHELGTLERVKLEATEFRRLKAISTDATNATNRQKTQIKNSVKMVMRNEELRPQDFIQVDDEIYRYDVTTSDKVDVEKLFKLFEDEKISREQLLASITVNKGECERICGAHVVNSISTTVRGKAIDVRVSTADKPIEGAIIVKPKDKPKAEKHIDTVEPVSANATSKRAGKLRPLRRITGR